jgi:putative ABC transport system permease protein
MLHHMRAALTRVRELFRRRAQSFAEQDEEFSFHLEMETAENIRRGMSEADARRAALLRFGGTQRFREETSGARGVVAIDNLARDARYALRRIRLAPAFAAGVVATLGIGIGAAAGIGTIVYGVLLRDLPYAEPDQLVRVGFHTDGIAGSGDLHSAATFVHFAWGARSFTDLGTYSVNDAFALTDRDVAERVTVALMTPSTFDLLGVRPVLGALFQRRDTSWVGKGDQLLPILISQELWERRYGADPTIIGRRIDIDHGPRMVIGVLPRSFDFPRASVSIWYPTAISLRRPEIAQRYTAVIGRLRDGVTMSQAETELNALIPSLSTRFPVITPELLQRSHARASVEPLKSATVAPVRTQLVLLGVLVAVVLLIATTNVVNLFLLRTERAGREIAIALSLGASRLALAQRFVIEGVVLGLASGIVAIPAAALALSTKFGFTEREIPRLHEVSFTAGTIALIVAGAALIGGVVGLTAVTRTGNEGLFDRLRATGTTPSRGWRRAQNGLVSLQVAIALTLLVAAGLLGRSFWNLRNAHIGFEPANALTFQVSLPWGPTGYANSYPAQAAFHAQVGDRLTALPGVTSVGGAVHQPLAGPGAKPYEIHFRAGGDGGQSTVPAAVNMASADYFRAMGIPLRGGRTFQSGDLRGSPAVILSERLATSIFGTTDVVGRSVVRPPPQPGAQSEFRVVGVVGDIQRGRIEDGYTPTAYFPLLRDGDGLPPDSTPVPYDAQEFQYVIRGTQLPGAPAIQRIVSELDRRVPAARIRTLDSIVDEATAGVRLTMLLIAVAGAAALLLGVIGVYSVVSYAAAGRAREFGIRLALGAAPARVGGMVLGDGLRLVAIGTVAGLVAALGATRFLRALLYEVEPTSVAEFGVATALLVVVTLVATLLPARRAAHTHPAVVLRGE